MSTPQYRELQHQREACTRALADVDEERARQRLKWGKQRHDFAVWIAVLGEEFGECCQRVLHFRHAEAEKTGALLDQNYVGARVHESTERRMLKLMRAEAVQVAAVAVAMIEHIDEELERYDGEQAESAEGTVHEPKHRQAESALSHA